MDLELRLMTHLLCEGIKMRKDIGDSGHSAVLRTLPLSGSLNKRINDSLTLVQIPCGTSFIRKTLSEIRLGVILKLRRC